MYLYDLYISDHLFHNMIAYVCLFALVLFTIMLISHYVHLYLIIYVGNISFDLVVSW